MNSPSQACPGTAKIALKTPVVILASIVSFPKTYKIFSNAAKPKATNTEYIIMSYISSNSLFL